MPKLPHKRNRVVNVVDDDEPIICKSEVLEIVVIVHSLSYQPPIQPCLYVISPLNKGFMEIILFVRTCLKVTWNDNLLFVIDNYLICHTPVVNSVKSALEFKLIEPLYALKWIVLTEVVVSLRRILQSPYTGKYTVIDILSYDCLVASHKHCLIILLSLFPDYLAPCLRLPARLIAILINHRQQNRVRNIINVSI